MTSQHNIQIHTVYSAHETAPISSSSSGLRLRLLGLLTFAVALMWLFITWQPMYKWIEKTLALGELNILANVMSENQQAGKGGDMAILSQLMNPKNKPANPSASPDTKPGDDATDHEEEATANSANTNQAEAQLAHRVLVGAAIGWLIIATFVGLWLAMSGMAGLASAERAFKPGAVMLFFLSLILTAVWIGWNVWHEYPYPRFEMWFVGLWILTGGVAAVIGHKAKRMGLLVLCACVLATGGLAWYTWTEYQWYESLLPDWVMSSLLGLTAIFAASIGALLSRRGVGLIRTGAYFVILSAVFSVIAIWASIRWGQMPADQANAMLYAKVFGVQSAYGWLMLLGTIRLR